MESVIEIVRKMANKIKITTGIAAGGIMRPSIFMAFKSRNSLKTRRATANPKRVKSSRNAQWKMRLDRIPMGTLLSFFNVLQTSVRHGLIHQLHHFVERLVVNEDHFGQYNLPGRVKDFTFPRREGFFSV